MKADMKPVDRGEDVALMEPLLLSERSRFQRDLGDLAVDLAAASAGFRRSLPPGVAASLSDLVRSMNCYYSNLIEGHPTHPIDIERAMRDDYSTDAETRNLQLEARAHVKVQRWIDGGSVAGRTVAPDAILEIHRRFCEDLPAELLLVENPDTGETEAVRPGALRLRDVKVGRRAATPRPCWEPATAKPGASFPRCWSAAS